MKKVAQTKLGELLRFYELHELVEIHTLNGELFKGSIGEFEKSKQFVGVENLPVKALKMTITEFQRDLYPTLIITLKYKIQWSADVQEIESE